MRKKQSFVFVNPSFRYKLKAKIIESGFKRQQEFCTATDIEWQHSIRHIYDPIDAEGKVATMEERIRRKLMMQNKWTKRDLQRAVNSNQYGIWVWEKAEKNLRNNEEMIFNAKSKAYAGSPILS
jgi:hypothetical protein